MLSRHFHLFCDKSHPLEISHRPQDPGIFGSLNRFIARQGVPSHIWSDNGTNFVGVTRRSKEMSALLNDNKAQEAILREYGRRDVEWHFIPPRAPHFGDLWETAVKSTKRLF